MSDINIVKPCYILRNNLYFISSWGISNVGKKIVKLKIYKYNDYICLNCEIRGEICQKILYRTDRFKQTSLKKILSYFGIYLLDNEKY